MNNIIYMSDAFSQEFPENQSTNFKCSVDDIKLNNIPDSPLSVGVKSIIFTLDYSFLLSTQGLDYKNKIFALRSNIKTETFTNTFGYPDIICVFNISVKQNYNPKTETVEIKFENPIFVSSSKQKLKLAHFQIYDLNTHTVLETQNHNTAIINCIVKLIVKVFDINTFNR